MYLILFVFTFIIFMHLVLAYGVNEVIKAWNIRDMMQEEVVNILDNLEEAIITKNENKVGLCNHQGTLIINNIKEENTCLEPEVLKAKIFREFEDENSPNQSMKSMQSGEEDIRE